MKLASLTISTIKSDFLDQTFGGIEKGPNPQSAPPLTDWNMARDDGPILARIIRWANPRRHLEFGTWKGFGACLVLENSSATVWTINLPSGEFKPDGSWAYSERLADRDIKTTDASSISLGQETSGNQVYQHTDAGFAIGRLYRERGFGHRVNQVYCDSRDWDTTAYPKGFFDTILIDGGHQSDVVASDTKKALPLLKEGGVIFWHDYCPNEAVMKKYPHVVSVIEGVESVSQELSQEKIALFWIDPSWILLGIKEGNPCRTDKSH